MGWNRVRSLYRNLCVRAFAALLVAVLSGSAAHAQGVFAQVSNFYISAGVGISGTVGNVPVSGLFQVNLIAGQPAPPPQILAPVSLSNSYVTVRVDGGATGAAAADYIFGQVTAAPAAGWVQVPTAVAPNRITAIWEVTDPHRVRVALELTLVHDMACYKFTVTNTDTLAHSIGLRFTQDYTPPRAIDGPILTPTLPPISSETDLFGSAIPTEWIVGETRVAATAGGMFPLQGDPGVITRPDRLAFGRDSSLTATWDFTANPSLRFDQAGFGGTAAVYFNPRLYGPGEERSFATYFGRAFTTSNFVRPFSAGMDAPFSLQFDSTKPAGMQLTPDPLTVTAFVYNPNQLPLTNVNAVLSLPSGLKLVTGETASKITASVDPNTETTFSWQVEPTETSSGRQSISVSFSAGPGTLGKVVTRTIDIPALPIQPFAGGLQMVSFPYAFVDPTPTAALGLSQVDFDLLRWNPVLLTYEAVSRILPGEGYWLRLASGRSITLQNATPVVVGTTAYEIRLANGWQQIGNPYLIPVRWAHVQVLNTDSSDPAYLIPQTIEQAAARGWILPTIYRYNETSGMYEFDQDTNTEIVPFKGYWVKALRSNLSLLIPPATGRAVKTTRAGNSSAGVGIDNWSLRIVASSGGLADGWNFLGVASGANDGVDRKDIEKPPSIQDHLNIGFVRDNWGSRAGLYAQDIQAAGGRKEWTLRVDSPRPNMEVTLSWPEIGSLPKGYVLTITDKATGVTQLMRQRPSLRVNTGEKGSRLFVITAARSTIVGGLRLTAAVSSPPGRAAAVLSVTPSTAATLTIRVISNGQTVRTFGATRAATAGSATTLTWDLRNNQGVAVPSGAYQFEVKGTTPEGESARIVIPHVVIR